MKTNVYTDRFQVFGANALDSFNFLIQPNTFKGFKLADYGQLKEWGNALLFSNLICYHLLQQGDVQSITEEYLHRGTIIRFEVADAIFFISIEIQDELICTELQVTLKDPEQDQLYISEKAVFTRDRQFVYLFNRVQDIVMNRLTGFGN